MTFFITKLLQSSLAVAVVLGPQLPVVTAVLVNCPICLEDKSDFVELHKPRIGPGHEFCSECFDSLVANIPDGSDKMKCPLCREAVSVAKEGGESESDVSGQPSGSSTPPPPESLVYSVSAASKLSAADILARREEERRRELEQERDRLREVHFSVRKRWYATMRSGMRNKKFTAEEQQIMSDLCIEQGKALREGERLIEQARPIWSEWDLRIQERLEEEKRSFFSRNTQMLDDFSASKLYRDSCFTREEVIFPDSGYSIDQLRVTEITLKAKKFRNDFQKKKAIEDLKNADIRLQTAAEQGSDQAEIAEAKANKGLCERTLKAIEETDKKIAEARELAGYYYEQQLVAQREREVARTATAVQEVQRHRYYEPEQQHHLRH